MRLARGWERLAKSSCTQKYRPLQRAAIVQATVSLARDEPRQFVNGVSGHLASPSCLESSRSTVNAPSPVLTVHREDSLPRSRPDRSARSAA